MKSEGTEVNPSELQNASRCVAGRTVRLSDRYVCDLVLRGLNYGRRDKAPCGPLIGLPGSRGGVNQLLSRQKTLNTLCFRKEREMFVITFSL
jgi:hypothetical protein